MRPQHAITTVAANIREQWCSPVGLMNTADDGSDFEVRVDLVIHFAQITQIAQCVQEFSEAGEVSRHQVRLGGCFVCWRRHVVVSFREVFCVQSLNFTTFQCFRPSPTAELSVWLFSSVPPFPARSRYPWGIAEASC